MCRMDRARNSRNWPAKQGKVASGEPGAWLFTELTSCLKYSPPLVFDTLFFYVFLPTILFSVLFVGFSSSVNPLKGGLPNYSALSPFSSIISLFNEYGFFNYYLYVDTSIYSQVFILHICTTHWHTLKSRTKFSALQSLHFSSGQGRQ